MLTAYAQLAGAMALTGVNVGAAKVLAGALPVAAVLGLRCVLAVLVLLPLARWRDGSVRPDGAILRNLFGQALLGTVLYNAALLAGLRLTGALEGGLVLATLPAAVAVGAALWLRERLPPRAWAAAALAAGGVAAVTLARAGPASGAGNGAAGSLPGVLLVFVGVCGEAAYALLARRAADRVPLLTASLWMQGFSAVLLLPFWLPASAAAAAALRDPGLLLLLVFHALTASVLSLLLWYAGVRRVPAATAGVFMAFLPGFAALTAVLFLGERFTAAHAAGLLLLAGSVALATWPGRRAA